MLKAGEKAPSVTLESDKGDKVSLGALGPGPVVVYFYPRDDAPGCTVEAKDFTAAKKQLEKLGARVYGVSKDSIASHCKFRDKYGLSFPLLSDPSLAAHRAFGAWGEKTMYGKKVEGVIRSTFLIQDGVVKRAWPSVKVAGHVDAVIGAIAELGAAPTTPGKAAAKTPAKAATKKAPVKKAAAKAPAKKAATKAPAKKGKK